MEKVIPFNKTKKKSSFKNALILAPSVIVCVLFVLFVLHFDANYQVEGSHEEVVTKGSAGNYIAVKDIKKDAVSLSVREAGNYLITLGETIEVDGAGQRGKVTMSEISGETITFQLEMERKAFSYFYFYFLVTILTILLFYLVRKITNAFVTLFKMIFFRKKLRY